MLQTLGSTTVSTISAVQLVASTVQLITQQPSEITRKGQVPIHHLASPTNLPSHVHDVRTMEIVLFLCSIFTIVKMKLIVPMIEEPPTKLGEQVLREGPAPPKPPKELLRNLGDQK